MTTKGERREELRRKRRHGMKVSGRSILTVAETVAKKAKAAGERSDDASRESQGN